MAAGRIRFSIDRGGTFTDVYAEDSHTGEIHIEKLLSEDPLHYPDAPREGIRRILQKCFPAKSFGTTISPGDIQWIRMGTTVATNALLERKGADTALVISKGFGDLLSIGDQTRPDLFDLKIIKPDLLYQTVLEIDERIRPLQENDDTDSLRILHGQSGEQFVVLKRPDTKCIRNKLQKIFQTGIRSIAVICMHAYSVYDHEQIIGKIAGEIGFSQISLSHQVIPHIKIVARGDTALVDAYLTPHIKNYLHSFQSGFTDTLQDCPLLFMQSAGGLTKASHFRGANAILSGPAGGVVGCGLSTYRETDNRPVIGFDMGGTSTDVSRYAGEYELVQETRTAGIRIQAPQMQIKTVAAGGGSRLFYKNEMLRVGPESAGAHPGPICYRKNGFLTITDANLFLGRIQPDYFPQIFGSNEDLPLAVDESAAAFKELTARINNDAQKKGLAEKTPEEVALGFLDVANETMIRPIMELSVMRGFDIKEHVLSCFGGAGGQHGCAIAASLGIDTVFIHQHAGILSAIGMSLAEIVVDRQEAADRIVDEDSLPHLHRQLQKLEDSARREFTTQCRQTGNISVEHYLELRFQGTDTPIMMRLRTGHDIVNDFFRQYQKEYGFLLRNRNVLADSVRVRISSTTGSDSRPLVKNSKSSLTPEKNIPCYFSEGWLSTPLYLIENIPVQTDLHGPALIIQNSSTILVEPGHTARRSVHGDIIIHLGEKKSATLSTSADPVQLAIFSNLFMSVAEQMGRTLQKTAVSTNIKERLDFSCAVFDRKGALIANAPHIPVHLGAMGEAVKYQIRHYAGDLKPGDVIASNHPAAGGSHLPDITIISPVWHNDTIIFFVANRGHHADIGGITPGSMPPFSTGLIEEGAAIRSFRILKEGQFQEKSARRLLTDFADPEHSPPISSARHLEDNISDLKAQIAANQNGIKLLQELVDKYSLPVVQAYMGHIQDNAEHAVRNMLKKLCVQKNSVAKLVLHGEDFLDDHSPIRLQVTIDPATGDALFDFRGSAKQLPGNLNCPPAVVRSAILYCLRCLINEDIPLNQGCLSPISIKVDPDSLLNPDDKAAVVGGNVLTSQRITDVILKAFEAAADSQGCTNNLTFGNADFGYYETIGGGAGAGSGWHGQSGVHTHMTNTRITDPEILERRYPVLLKEFSLRKDSGGKGKYRGGNGLVRHIEALADLQLSILSERREIAPHGIRGGKDGLCGKNSIITSNGEENIGGKYSCTLHKGDSIIIRTPGGGGYGEESGT